jgi:hypothetical protein
MVENAEIVRWIVTGLLGLVVYFGKQTLTDVKEKLNDLQQEQQNFRMNYIHKDSFKEFKDELRALFAEIKADIKDIKNGS